MTQLTPEDEWLGILRAAVLITARRIRFEQPVGKISGAEFSILARAHRRGPITIGDLARAEHVRPPSITQIVERLEAAGFATREMDPADRRQVLVSATPAGAELIDRAKQARIEWLRVRVERLSENEREALKNAAPVLHRIAEEW